MAINPLMKSAYAAQLAANSMVVSKRLPQRRPLDASSRLYLPVQLQSLPRLLDHNLDELGGGPRKTARISTAAVAKTTERTSAYDVRPGLASTLMSTQEKQRLDGRRQRELKDSSPRSEGSICRYCSLFDELFHDGGPPSVLVVNHNAGIDVDFDSETNISKAWIRNYQLLLPKEYASTAIDGTHPLLWDHSAEAFFEETAPAQREGQKPRESWSCHSAGKSADGSRRWQDLAAYDDVGYLYERAVWPWNERLTTRVENVLKIKGFANTKLNADDLWTATEALKNPDEAKAALLHRARAEEQLPVDLETSRTLSHDEARILRYQYSLESCIRSSYGIGWEDYNGLNIDDGKVSNFAIHWSKLRPQHVANLSSLDLQHLYLSLRRIAEAKGCEPDIAKEIGLGITWVQNHQLDKKGEEACKRVQWIAAQLSQLWQEEFWFLDVSASKALRFSMPLNGPVEMWSALTWMAPAILFTFLNGAVCQLPHTLLRTQSAKASAKPNPANSSAT